MGGGSLLRTVRLAVLTQDDGWADHSLGEVVVEGHLGLVQEGEEVIPMLAQPLSQAQGVGVAVDRLAVWAPPLGQGSQPPVDQPDAAFMALRLKVGPFAQTDIVADQSPQLLGKDLPLGRVVM